MLASMLLPVALQAQSELLKYSPIPERWGNQQSSARIDLPGNQKLMGHYTSDSIATKGVAMQSAGLQPVAVMLEPDELDVFQGGKIVAFRVGLVDSAEIARVFVIPVTAKGKYGNKTEWTCSASDVGWNVINLETPYEINLADDDKLLIGFYFRQTEECMPLSLVKVGKPYDSYTYKKVGSSGKWRELGFINDGNLSVQCIVEKDDYPDYWINAYGLSCNDYAQIGGELSFAMEVKNKGIKTVEAGALTLSVSIDGRQVATVTNEDAFYDDFYTLTGKAPCDGLEPGDHLLSIQVVAVNGEPIEDGPSFDHEFRAFEYLYPRQKHLVEQLTSTYCTYCPLGNSTLSILTSQRDDIIWVGIHGNLGTGVDPFRSNQGDSIMSIMTGGYVSYPSGAFDRSTGWDSDTEIINGLGFYEEYHQIVADMLGEYFDYIGATKPSFAEVKGNCYVNEQTRVATVTVKGNLTPDFDLMMGDDARLTVYLVEDSLVAQQLNLGNWETEYVHNGVFRKALGSVWGNKLNRDRENHYKNTFRVTIPNSWNWKKMRVVAFISRPLRNALNGFTDLYVNNADVFNFRLSTGVEETLTDEKAVPVEYYDIMGHRFDNPQPGINIVRMSDGTARKILVK